MATQRKRRRKAQTLWAPFSPLAAAGLDCSSWEGGGCCGCEISPRQAFSGVRPVGRSAIKKYRDISQMNEMALKSTKKKKKHQFFPDLLSPSLQEDVSRKKEKEARFLHLFDGHLNYLETPTKSQEKVKAKNHRKKWKAWERAKKKNPSLSMEKENIILCAENMNIPVYQKDKCLRESKHQSSKPHCLDFDKREVCKTLDSSFLEFLMKSDKKARVTRKESDKKAKRHHNSECSDGTQEVFRGTKDKQLKTRKSIPKGQGAEKQFCFPLFLDPFVNGKGGQKGLSQKETSKLRMPCKSKLDPPSSFRDSTIKGIQQNRKLHKGILHKASITKISSHANTGSLLSSTPRTLEIKTCDSEELLDTGDQEDNQPFQMSSDPEAISSGIDSQELFITQQVHTSSLPVHPPNHAKEAVLEGSDSNSNTSNSLQFSQASAAKETFENSFLLISRSPTPSKRGKHFPATRECGIQTDDFFSSSAVASSFLIKKEPMDCHEQPLDLSLPYRIRSSATSAEMFPSLEGAGDGIAVSPRCKLEIAIKVLDDESENLMGSQSRKSEDIKYIQTHLNSSYYFKLKGEPDVTVSGSPLVKLKDPDVTVLGTPLGRLTWEKRKRKNNSR